MEDRNTRKEKNVLNLFFLIFGEAIRSKQDPYLPRASLGDS